MSAGKTRPASIRPRCGALDSVGSPPAGAGGSLLPDVPGAKGGLTLTIPDFGWPLSPRPPGQHQ